MAMPAVVGVGAFGAGQGAVTAAFPTAYTPTADDVGIIFQECENADTPTAPAGGWAIITTQAVASGTTTKLTAYWLRFAGGESAPSVPDPGNHQMSQMIVVSGCKTTGNPWNIFTSTTELTSDTSVSIPGVTTTADNCLILAAFSTGRDGLNGSDATGFANASLANVTEQMDRWTAQGLGGGLAMATGEKAAAGATGATTATVGTANFKALMTIALEGASAAGATVTPTTVAGTAAVGTATVAAGATTTVSTVAATASVPAATVSTGGRAAPTYPAAQDLVEGTGTRSFTAVTTSAGDYLVVEAIGEDGAVVANLTPDTTGLTWTNRTNVGASGDVRVQQWTAPDAAGGSRTVQITPSSGTANWRARLTVVRGSDGPAGTGTSGTAQTVSVVRQNDNSGMFMIVGDWSAGAVGSPTWTPGGTTTASQQGTAATYVFGRWNDSGAAATASHGISSPAYTTPSVAVLEMLGTGASPDATVTPSTVAATAAVGSPTIRLSVAITAATVAATATTPLPTVRLGVSISPSTVAAAGSIGTAAVRAGTAATPASVVAAASVAAPTVTAGGSAAVAASTVTCTATAPTPTVAAGAVVTAATVAGLGAVPAATVQAASTTTPSTVAATASVPAPTVAAGARAAAATVASAAAVAAPSVTVGGSATVSATTVNTVAAVAAPTVQASSRISASTVAAFAAVPTVTVRLSVGITPATIAGLTAVGTPVVSVGPPAPMTVLAVASVPNPTVTTVGGIITRPDTGIIVRPYTGIIVRP